MPSELLHPTRIGRLQVSLLKLASVRLNSGRVSAFKIECDALDDDDVVCAARLMSRIVPPFGHVVGVPRGGVRFAQACQQYIDGMSAILIVDDVFTTGGSMERMRKEQASKYPNAAIHGVVLFARGETPGWITPVFMLHEAAHRL